MNDQLQVLEELITVTESAGVPVWFMGGYGLDALPETRTRRPDEPSP